MAEPADTPVALGGENMADVPSDTPGAFAFEARRARMHWRAIHAVDVDRVMRENDIDTLESVLVRHGETRNADAVPKSKAPTTTFSVSDAPHRCRHRPLNQPFSALPTPNPPKPNPRHTGNRDLRGRFRGGLAVPHHFKRPEGDSVSAVPG
jgi:hypothetical protein